jgi:beta-phosphoglucomutase-like phosphatase (HAD superfamily)
MKCVIFELDGVLRDAEGMLLLATLRWLSRSTLPGMMCLS